MSEQEQAETVLAMQAMGNTSVLDVYGAGEDIKTLARRIKLCLPGGERLGESEALALAQLSIAYSLNPFNGEVWYIPGKGTMVGIKGLRKAARKQAQYWIEHVILTPQERDDLSIPDKAIAYKCLVYRSDLIRQSAEAIHMMYQAGMKDAAERYAYTPTVGIGYWMQGESTKMKPDQVARKRAEADALKVAFDLPFAGEIGNGNRVGYVDAEEWEVRPVQEPALEQPLADQPWPGEFFDAGQGDGQVARVSRFEDGEPVPTDALSYYDAYLQDKAKVPASLPVLRSWAKAHKVKMSQ